VLRKLTPFRAFLDVAADASAQIVNYSKIARAVGSDPVSVKSYFGILEDTLLGFHLPAYDRSLRARQRHAPKFYFFDLGIQAALRRHLHLQMSESTYEFGRRFEQFVVTEIFRLNSYRKTDYALSRSAYPATKPFERFEALSACHGNEESRNWTWTDCRSTESAVEAVGGFETPISAWNHGTRRAQTRPYRYRAGG
jgi:hypothetical protein